MDSIVGNAAAAFASVTQIVNFLFYVILGGAAVYFSYRWLKQQSEKKQEKVADQALEPKRQLIRNKLASVKTALNNETNLAQNYEAYARDYSAWENANALNNIPGVEQDFLRVLSEAFIEKGIRPPADYRKYFRIPSRVHPSERLVYAYSAPASAMKKTYETYSENTSESVRGGFFSRGVREGSSHSTRVEGLEERAMGYASITLTDKAIYISASGHSEKIPYNDIVEANLYTDSIGITKSRAPETPLYIYASPGDRQVTYMAIYGQFMEPRTQSYRSNVQKKRRAKRGNQQSDNRQESGPHTLQ